MKTCLDCGCRLISGVCSNCQEELFIIENQADDIVQPLSDEFVKKAKDQREYLKKQEKQKLLIEGLPYEDLDDYSIE
jgi:hypothetical protein